MSHEKTEILVQELAGDLAAVRPMVRLRIALAGVFATWLLWVGYHTGFGQADLSWGWANPLQLGVLIGLAWRSRSEASVHKKTYCTRRLV